MALNASAQYAHQNIDLLDVFDDSTVTPESTYGIRYQACWGWTDGNGKEYGIIGSTAGTYILDVTNPTDIVQVDYIPGRRNNCIWHEYKTFGNYLYIISDDGGNNSFQIADLSYLPDSAHVIYDSTDIFVHSHTLFIDGDKLYVGSVSTTMGFSSMNVYSLADPTHPTLMRRLDEDYAFISSVHDMFVSNDTVYASCGYQGLYIFKFETDSNRFVLLGTRQDVNSIYNHSSVLSPDHQTLYVCDEVPDGQPIQILDVSNINNPSLVSTFFSNAGATPHNPELKDNMLIIAYYQDGVYIYDITNPQSPAQIGFFDTYYTNPTGVYPWPTYNGVWSTYAHLPSGTLLASDTEFGLFTLDITGVTGIESPVVNAGYVFPNPASRYVFLDAPASKVEILDKSGRLVISQENVESPIDVSALSAGLYVVRSYSKNGVSNSKLMIQ